MVCGVVWVWMVRSNDWYEKMIHGRFIVYLQLGQDIGRNFGWVSNQGKCIKWILFVVCDLCRVVTMRSIDIQRSVSV